MVGGINAPKKIKCRGQDGKIYIQLVKGKDDLRQDAVMQQVFGLVNTLLSSGVKSQFRAHSNLNIRQYKVSELFLKYYTKSKFYFKMSLRSLQTGHSIISTKVNKTIDLKKSVVISSRVFFLFNNIDFNQNNKSSSSSSFSS